MRARFRTRADAKTVPIIPIEKDVFDAWRADQPETTRAWMKSTGFKAAPRSLSFVSGENGSLGSVLLGTEAHDDFWAYADLPGRLPEGTYRIDARMDRAAATGAALGWAMGCYAFDRYVAKSAAPAPALVWPEGANRAHVRAAAEATTAVRDLINTPAGDMGPAELAAAARRVAETGGAETTEIKGAVLLRPRLSDDSRGRPGKRQRAAADRSPLGSDRRAQGDLDRQGRLLRFRRPRHQAGPGHASHEEGHGRGGACPGARSDDHGHGNRRQVARSDSRGREQHFGRCVATARRHQDAERDYRRGRQYRRRRAAHHVRCPDGGRNRTAGTPDRLRHPDGRREDGVGSGASRRSSATTTPSRRSWHEPENPSPTRSGDCRCGSPIAGCWTARPRTSTTFPRAGWPERSPPRCICRSS